MRCHRDEDTIFAALCEEEEFLREARPFKAEHDSAVWPELAQVREKKFLHYRRQAKTKHQYRQVSY
jgi:hypothetical protein